MTYNEDELLFNGSPEDCHKYLLKYWSVNVNELRDNLELQSLFCDYLRHIWYDTTEWKDSETGEYTSIDKLEESPYVRDSDTWHKIDANKFIFNRELIEIIEEPLTEDSFWEECCLAHLIQEEESYKQELAYDNYIQNL